MLTEVIQPYESEVFWLSQEFVSGINAIYPGDKYYNYNQPQLLRTTDTKWSFLGNLFEEGVREHTEQQVGWEGIVLGNTIQLMFQLRRALVDQHIFIPKSEKPALIYQVMAYVENHLNEKINLENTAQSFHISKSTISQTFRKSQNVSFYQYVTERRLIVAKSLIAQGVKLEEVSQRVCFSDYSTFYRAFKQEYGISPTSYKGGELATGNMVQAAKKIGS